MDLHEVGWGNRTRSTWRRERTDGGVLVNAV
jgi:hypothetical protein